MVAIPQCSVTRLAWTDLELGGIALPSERMVLRSGFGSGLTVRRGAAEGALWAVGDRGPNLKASTALKRYGVVLPDEARQAPSAKLMPRPDIGPALAQLRVREDGIELMRALPIADAKGRPISGLPIPGSLNALVEPAFTLAGERLGADPSGADTEGIAALASGGFWIADEYGPSLLQVDREGMLIRRLVPEGAAASFGSAGCAIEASLPAIAARRHFNRGFEAIALSPDEGHLYLAFQSPLAHPDGEAHEQARHVRLWRLATASGRVEAQFLYPLDAPDTFRRDKEEGKFEQSDVKVSEMAMAGQDELLVLERGSYTAKIYRVARSKALALPVEHLEIDTRPTIEELSAGDPLDLPVLAKTLLFTTDDHPEIAADLEGMAILSPHELLLVTDNDFGVEGAETSFWRLRFAEPLFND
jgi:hypothetical protein